MTVSNPARSASGSGSALEIPSALLTLRVGVWVWFVARDLLRMEQCPTKN